MDEAIRNLCLTLKDEADAVIGCTDKIASLLDGSNKASQTLEMIRLDGVAHIQSLTLAITELMSGGSADDGGDPDA